VLDAPDLLPIARRGAIVKFFFGAQFRVDPFPNQNWLDSSIT
jgi:hypothetical protein